MSSSSSGGLTSDEDIHYSDESDCDNSNDESFVFQMEKKYLDNEEALEFIEMFGISPCHLAVKHCLELVILNRTNISCIGNEERFASMVKNVCDLDLGWNNIHEWKFLLVALQHLPLLQCLNISYNPLPIYIENPLPKCDLLNTLILNGSNLPMTTLSKLISFFPNINELHLSDNDFNNLLDDTSSNIYSNKLSIIHLNCCHLKSWTTVLQILCHFQNLQNVYLSGNDFKTITSKCDNLILSTPIILKNVQLLCLSECKINSWQSIEVLSSLPALSTLKLTMNPIMNISSYNDSASLLIARMPNLSVLNGTSITLEQRIVSERFFIRHYYDKPNKNGNVLYNNLVEKHGNLQQLASIDLSPQMTANVFLTIDESETEIPVHINLNKTVHALMRYAEKVSGINVSKMRLFHFNIAVSELGPTELRSPNQELKYLKIENGDKIMIQPKMIIPTKKRTVSQNFH